MQEEVVKADTGLVLPLAADSFMQQLAATHLW